MEGTKINLKKLYTRSDERTHRRRHRLFLSRCSTCWVELTVVPYLPVAIKHIPLKNASPPPQHHRIMRRTPADFSRRQPAPLACPTDCIPTQHTHSWQSQSALWKWLSNTKQIQKRRKKIGTNNKKQWRILKENIFSDGIYLRSVHRKSSSPKAKGESEDYIEMKRSASWFGNHAASENFVMEPSSSFAKE
jgi:hypothetical protein